MTNNDLSHHGILGQKWGVRRYQNEDGTLTPAGRSRYRQGEKNDSYENVHDDYKKAHQTKSVKTMSDAELRNRLNRLQMEKQYSQISQVSVNKGKQYFDKVVKAGTTVAAITTTAITIYNNVNKIKSIIEKSKK